MATITADDYSPIYANDVEVPLSIQFLHKNDQSPVSLSGATITMKMQNTDGIIKICNGTWTIDDTTNGKAHYQWQTADVNTIGNWMLYVTITISGAPVHADAKPLEILYAP